MCFLPRVQIVRLSSETLELLPILMLARLPQPKECFTMQVPFPHLEVLIIPNQDIDEGTTTMDYLKQ